MATNINTLKSWFKTGLKPTQEQFWAWMDSYWHKDEKIPQSSITDLENTLNAKAEKDQLDGHKTDPNAHADLFAGKLSGSIATDAETQITAPVAEDNKVVSRSKLFNWFDWIKKQSQTISGSWTFTNTVTAQEAKLENELTTLNQVRALATLQAILEENPFAQVDELESYIRLLGGTEGKRLIEMLIGSDSMQNSFTITPTTANLQSSELIKNLTAIISVENGLIKLKQTDDEELVSTDIVVEKPVSDSRYIFKAKTEGKDYFVATTEDIPAKTPDATTTVKGSVKLAGDLGGTADAPTVPALASKLTGTIATDAETQITVAVAEDNKVVSRSKLFNWWVWNKQQNQNVSGDWRFDGALQYGSIGHFHRDYSTFYIRAFQDKMLTLGIENLGKDSLTISNNGIEMFFRLLLMAGTTTTPSLIIPNGVLTTVPQNGAIERDSNGQLWETHSGVRSRLITSSDGVILIAFKQPSNIQINIAGSISATATNTSYDTIIGKIGNNSVLRLNALNEVYYPSPSSGTVAPTIAKTEIFLKINNGLFATAWDGSNSTNQVKIMEFLGLNNNGFKNYQNPIMTNIQNSDPLLAQWSTIQLALQTINNGAVSNSDVTYYLRNADNTRAFGANEASFNFVFKNTVTYADATNANGQNTDRTIRFNNYSLFIETIR